MGGVTACEVGDGKGRVLNGYSGTTWYVSSAICSCFLARSITKLSFALDPQDEVKLHLFHNYVSDFRFLLERLEASLKGFIISPSFSHSLQVLKPIPLLPRHVVGSGSGAGMRDGFGAKGDESSDEATDTSSDITEIEGLVEMDWETD
jgi:hypothetical protein